MFMLFQCFFLNASGESTVVKAATFIDNFIKILRFQHEIVTTREEKGQGVPPRKLLLIDLTRRSNQVLIVRMNIIRHIIIYQSGWSNFKEVGM